MKKKGWSSWFIVPRSPWVVLLVVVGALGAASLAGWWIWGRRGEAPPSIPAGADPAVAAAVEAFRQRVLREPASAAAWGELGEVLMANGYPHEADVCLARAETLDSAEPRWPYLRGWGLLPRDRGAGLDLLRRAADRCRADDEYAEAVRLRLGEELLAVGRAEEAQALYCRFLDDHPANVRAQFGIGLAAAALDDPRSGVAHLSHCTDSPFARKKACAELAVLFQRLDDPQAADDFTRRAGQAPKDLEWPDPYFKDYDRRAVGRAARFEQAEDLQAAGRLEDAADVCRALIRDYPDEAPAHVELGMALDQMGDYVGAEKEYRAALDAAPDNVQAYYFLSVALYHQAAAPDPAADPAGLYREAADCARKAVALKPDHAFAHLYLGLCLKELGRKDEAIASLRQAVLCNPASAEPHLHLGEALAEKGDQDEALAELNRAADAAGDDDERPREALKKWRAAFGKPD